jgi:hypothetical protein
MGIIKKEVRYLKKGDVLSGNGAEVISDPTAGLRTPTGKMEIGIKYPNGVQKIQTWGKYTVVGVKTNDVIANTGSNPEPNPAPTI